MRNSAAALAPLGAIADIVHRPSVVQLLTFDVGERRIALLAAVVQEVTWAVAVTPLPKAPPIIEGVINLRGTLVPVLDIRRRFALPAQPVTPQQHFIVAHAGRRLVALRVDRALDLVAVQEEAIEAAARLTPGVEYVAGIAKLGDDLVVIHDLEQFLSLEESEQVDTATADALTTGEVPPPQQGRR